MLPHRNIPGTSVNRLDSVKHETTRSGFCLTFLAGCALASFFPLALMAGETTAPRGQPNSRIGITPFNEWHEGTQIEPAVPKKVGDYTYEDYTPRSAHYYLDRTAHWVGEFEKSRRAPKFQNHLRETTQ